MGNDDLPPPLARLVASLAHDETRRDTVWLRVRMARLDPQLLSGWKLHISATPGNYAELLDSVVPLLLTWGGAFKAANALDVVEQLNDGHFGLPQVGKALTAYPHSEAEAAQLCETLACAASAHNEGPVIPGDSRFNKAAPVYFRYGPFDARYRIDAMGRRQRLVRTPGGDDVPDAADGGPGAHVAPTVLPRVAHPDHLGFLRGRFLFAQVAHLTAKGGVFVAVPRGEAHPQARMIKTARRGTNSDRFGRDAIWALEREHALLHRLAGKHGFPPAGTLHRDGDAVLALERPWLDGHTLWERWCAPDGRTPAARREMAQALREALEIVNVAHAAGVVVRDCSMGNFLMTRRGVLLLDLEIASEIASGDPPYRRGTHGFYDPLMDRFAPADTNADRYGLLALAWMILRGEHPAWHTRGLHDSIPEGTPGYRDDTIGRAFARAWATRGDAGSFKAAYIGLLESVNTPQSPLPPPRGEALRAKLLEALRGALQSEHWNPQDPDTANVYSGLAGVLHAAMDTDAAATTDLVRTAGFARVRDFLLAAAAPIRHIPGYYFGVPGIAAILSRLAVAANDADSFKQSVDLLDRVDISTVTVPDLCQGGAGYVAACLDVLESLHASPHLLEHDAVMRKHLHTIAARGVDRLLALAVPKGENGLAWPWPEGAYGSLSGAANLGYAHGIAGVAAALFRAADALQLPAARDAAERGLITLHRTAQAVHGEPGACWWPVHAKDDSSAWNAWCHGAPGIVLALCAALHARHSDEDEALLIRALRGIGAANNAHWCLCHGVTSRLAAYNAASRILPPTRLAPFAPRAMEDACLLGNLHLDVVAGNGAGIGVQGHGANLMTGTIGVWRCLLDMPDLPREQA